MKLLKYRYPFGGHMVVAIATSLCGLLNAFLVLQGWIPAKYMLFSFLLSDLLGIGIAFLIAQRLSAEEKEKIANAPLPLWEPATPEVLQRVRSLPVHPGLLISSVFCFIFTLPMTLIIYRIYGEERNIYTAMCNVLLTVEIILVLWALFLTMLPVVWRNADESTVCTKLEISRVYNVRRPSRYQRNRRDYYAVCYTSDGRLRLRISEDEEHAAHIIVAKCGPLMTYVTDFDTDPISIMRKTHIYMPLPDDKFDDK